MLFRNSARGGSAFGGKNKIKKRAPKIIPGNRAVIVGGKKRKSAGTNHFFSKILYFFLLLIFVGVTGYLLFFSPFLLVTKINVSGTEQLDAGAVGEAAKAAISGKYMNLIPKNNIIWASKNNIKNNLETRFKRIKDVQVKKIFPDTLGITVAERQSSLVLCSNNSCFVIDNNGVPYAKADFTSDELGENELIVLNDDGNKTVNLGDSVLDPDYLQYLADIRDKLRNDAGIDIDRNYHTPQLVSGDIRVVVSSGFQIYFNQSIPIQKEIDMLKLVWDEKINDNQKSDLEYIDLRTDNKVYYKFKSTDQQQQQDSSTADIEKNTNSKDNGKPKNT